MKLPLQLPKLNIWDVIIFGTIPIKLSLIILVTIQIASIRAEIGHGLMAPMNLRVTSALRRKSLQLPPGLAVNPAAQRSPKQLAEVAAGRSENGSSLSCCCKAWVIAAGPRPVGSGEVSRPTGGMYESPEPHATSPVCFSVPLSRWWLGS